MLGVVRTATFTLVALALCASGCGITPASKQREAPFEPRAGEGAAAVAGSAVGSAAGTGSASEPDEHGPRAGGAAGSGHAGKAGSDPRAGSSGDGGGDGDGDGDGDAGPSHALPSVATPVVLGTLAGNGMPRAQEGLRFYGTDMGITYAHGGELYVLFGDTWPDAEHICEVEAAPFSDDTFATLPLEYQGGVPALRFATQPDVPDELSYITLTRSQEPLSLGYGQAPLAGFSDGQHAFAFFERLEPHPCGALPDGVEACSTEQGFECAEDLGVCEPAYVPFTVVCDVASGAGCQTGQECVPHPLCLDPTSSQMADDSYASRERAVAHTLELAIAGADRPEAFESVLSFPTNKFSVPSARTVARFSGKRAGSDYRPGHGQLLLWGRPGLTAEQERTGHLYLMTHELPLQLGDDGKLVFTPRYFAGIEEATGEPSWSSRESEAVGLALDGVEEGDPYEPVSVLTTMSIAWLDAPISKWVMLYGGDLADHMLLDPAGSRSARSPGAIWMRFADHPWGPWSLPAPHLVPGSPLTLADPYGPGGYLYHSACEPAGGATCAPTDPRRPLDTTFANCPVAFDDPGRLYAPNIIAEHTRVNDEGGLDLIWNVSTWNPYAVKLLKTSVLPAASLAPTADELADSRALARLGDWQSLPVLGEVRRYEQQTSYDRGTEDETFPLSGFGNRDFNNFVCLSDDAEVALEQYSPYYYDLPECPEDYVQGAVISRFAGSGHMVRMWLGIQSLLYAPADDEVLRIYVDDDPVPRVDVPLAAALDGRAGEIFAPPFGAGSTTRMSWYYPVSFQKKLIVALDRLGELDNYFYHCDVVWEDESPEPLSTARLPERELALRQLSSVFHPAGTHGLLHQPLDRELAPGERADITLDGPATIHAFSVRIAESQVARLRDIAVSVRWDDRDEPAIDVRLSELLGGSVPPERSSLALTSVLAGEDRTLTLKLPMPFSERARITLANEGEQSVSLSLRLRGSAGVPSDEHGYLHVQRTETRGPTDAAHRVAVLARGRGRLVGVCNELEGSADPNAGIMYDHLNLLEGDVRVTVDGKLALIGTGSEEYADDVFYFVDAPHANAFVQAWGVVNDLLPPSHASFCRWHVLGTELDFHHALELTYELGGAGNPEIVELHKTIAYLYLDPESRSHVWPVSP